MRRKLRLNNGTHFTLVLLSLIVAFTALFWFGFTYFPRQWGWNLSYLRRGVGGRSNVNSAFVMFSAITGGLAGILVTDKLRRGWNDPKEALVFVVPCLAAFGAIGMTRLVELTWGALGVTLQHALLIGGWLALLAAYRFVTLAIAKKAGNRDLSG